MEADNPDELQYVLAANGYCGPRHGEIGLDASDPSAALHENRLNVPGSIDPATADFTNTHADKPVALVEVEFESAADGRGFSLVAWLRSVFTDVTIVATGQLNPDQVSLVFGSGFDALVVNADRWHAYGADAWQHAMKPAVTRGYLARAKGLSIHSGTHTGKHSGRNSDRDSAGSDEVENSIWARRTTAQGGPAN